TRPRQRGHPSTLSRRARPFLAGIIFCNCLARVRRRHDGADLSAVLRSLGTEMGVRLDVARTSLDSLFVDAHRTRPPLPAIRRGSLQSGNRPRAALRDEADRGGKWDRMSIQAQGTLVLIVTLVVLLSGTPVAFGLGAISIVFLLIFHGADSLNVVAETFF